MNSEKNDKDYMDDRNQFIEDHFINNGVSNTITFVSTTTNSKIIGNGDGNIYQYFDAINMRKLKGYYRTTNLTSSPYKNETALKYTVNVDTGNSSVLTYPNNLSF